MSLEQAAILARSHGLLPKCVMQATDIMRKQVRSPAVDSVARDLSLALWDVVHLRPGPPQPQTPCSVSLSCYPTWLPAPPAPPPPPPLLGPQVPGPGLTVVFPLGPPSGDSGQKPPRQGPHAPRCTTVSGHPPPPAQCSLQESPGLLGIRFLVSTLDRILVFCGATSHYGNSGRHIVAWPVT